MLFRSFMLRHSQHLICSSHTLKPSQLFPICTGHSSQSHIALSPAHTKATAPLKSKLLDCKPSNDHKLVFFIPLCTALCTSQSHILEKVLLLSPEELDKTAILSKLIEFTPNNFQQSWEQMPVLDMADLYWASIFISLSAHQSTHIAGYTNSKSRE